jgi:hypothetical protein
VMDNLITMYVAWEYGNRKQNFTNFGWIISKWK